MCAVTLAVAGSSGSASGSGRLSGTSPLRRNSFRPERSIDSSIRSLSLNSWISSLTSSPIMTREPSPAAVAVHAGPGEGRVRALPAESLSRPLQVASGAGVDPDSVALAHEQRHLHGCAGGHFGRLVATGRGVALKAGLCLYHLELDCNGQLHVDGLIAVGHEIEGHVLGHPFDVVAQHVAAEGQLVIGLGVHEVVLPIILVLELHGVMVQPHAWELLAGLDRALDIGAGAHVLELHAYL